MKCRHTPVAPYAGAWIETGLTIGRNPGERRVGRPLRGGVDRNPRGTGREQAMDVAPYAGAWIETHLVQSLSTVRMVAPYAGAWIETHQCPPGDSCAPMRRPLRGGVDRNKSASGSTFRM